MLLRNLASCTAVRMPISRWMAAHATAPPHARASNSRVPGACSHVPGANVGPCGILTLRAVAAEAAFTLIELMVAMIVLSLVVGIAGYGVISSLESTNEAGSTGKGRAMANEAAERLGAEVRAARSRGRDGTGVVDIADLRRAVRTNGTLYDINGTALDWRDLAIATPNALTFQADIVDEAGASIPECVTWSAPPTRSWSLTRTVRRYTPGCTTAGAVLESDEVTERTSVRPAPGTAGSPPLFTYVVARSAVGGCSGIPTSAPTAADRNRVVAIKINFTSLVERRANASAQDLQTEVSLRSRSGSDYQYAMGCDE